MSEPFDRSLPTDPGSGRPIEDPDAGGATADDWSGSGSSWDDWPPITPPPGDYADDAVLPVSDPWAESWDEEPGSQVDTDTAPYEPPPIRYEPATPYEPEPAPYEPPALEGPESTRYEPEPALSQPPAAQPEWVAPEPDPPAPPGPSAWGADQAALEAPEEPPAAAWSSPWRVDSTPEWMAEPVEDRAVEVEPEVPVWTPAWPASTPLEPGPEPIQGPEPEPIPQFEPEPQAEPMNEPAGPVWTPASPTPQGQRAEPEPQAEPVAESELGPEEIWAQPGPEAQSPQFEQGYEAAGEPTQVLPTSWVPPAPARETLDPEAGSVRTSFGEAQAEADAVTVEHPAVAEQAVPWLIGVILLLAGMVIVLLALIFAGDASLGGAGASPRASGELPGAIGSSGDPTPSSDPSVAPSRPAVTARPRPSPTPIPAPEYGALELVYQGRSAALAPIYLLRRDFTVEGDPAVLAQDPGLDVRRFAWAPDGTVGAALLADVLVSVEPGVEKRNLGDEISTATFGRDASTLYAVRVVQEGSEDTATVLAIDFKDGETTEVGRVSYTRPEIAAEPALQEAQFADDGGTVRLFWMEDRSMWLWILGAGAWEIDPESGELTELDGEILPVLWAPDGRHRIELTTTGTSTTMELLDAAGEVVESATVDALVSHVRWSRDSRRVTYTAGRLAPGGGVLQDLYLWDPEEGTDPAPMTAAGAAFGAEWLGTQPLWRPPE